MADVTNAYLPCPDCNKDWGHGYCGTCQGHGSIRNPDYLTPLEVATRRVTELEAENAELKAYPAIIRQTRDRLLTPEEVAKYDKIRALVAQECPALVPRTVCLVPVTMPDGTLRHMEISPALHAQLEEMSEGRPCELHLTTKDEPQPKSTESADETNTQRSDPRAQGT